MLSGKGYFIQQIEKCAPDAATLVSRAKAAKLEHLIIKIADGAEAFPFKAQDATGAKEKLTAEAIAALRAAGISVWGWATVYGTKPEPAPQAQRIVQRMAQFGLEGLVINAEKLPKNGWRPANAKKFMDTLIEALPRANIKNPLLALNSYRYLSFHPDFPFDEFMTFCQIAMPQVFWVNRNGGDPIKELQGSYEEYSERYPDKAFIPVGAAFGENIGAAPNQFYWEARPDQITLFLNQVDALDFPAASFWTWDSAWARRALWDTVAAHPLAKPIGRVGAISIRPAEEVAVAADDSDSETTRATTTISVGDTGATGISNAVVGLPDSADDDGEAIIEVGAPGYQEGIYSGASGELNTFARNGMRFTWTKGESQRSTTYAQWLPRIDVSGEYLIEAFVPGINATARRVRYHITGVVGQAATMVVELNQLNVSDNWARLGFFEIDGAHQFSGMVATNNLVGTEANADTRLVYGPVRWRRVERKGVRPGFADGFDSPVGTEEERRQANSDWGSSRSHWNGAWVDANPFLNHYFLGYHTGVDLNLPGDKDRGAPAYSIADGVVIHATNSAKNRDGSPSGFGTLIIIKHDPYLEADGSETVAYSRYAHMKDLLVEKGDRVRRGDKVGTIWNIGTQAHHLHFDISTSGVLETSFGHWPGERKQEVIKHYVDPYDFIRGRRPRA
jgi:murein DD-endopeptidase MepM/ murein hydrolase activator NlpD